MAIRSPGLPRKERNSPAVQSPPAGIPLRFALPLAALLVGIVFAVYSPSLGFQFILDDHRFTADPRIQNSGHIWDYFTSFVWAQYVGGPPSFYRPVFLLWIRLNYLLTTLSPWGWHFLSIAKHLLAAALLGMLVWKLLRDPIAAFCAVALFALHPAQTESVSWVAVPDPLMAAAILAALLFYLKYSDRGLIENVRPSRRSRKSSAPEASQSSAVWLLASSAAYFAALLAKETAIVFPIVIFALGMQERRADPETKSRSQVESSLAHRLPAGLRQTVPFAIVTGIYLLMRFDALEGKLSPVTQHLPWKTVLLSWPGVFWFYLRVIVWPIKSYAFADPVLVETPSVREVLIPLLAILFAAAILIGVLFWFRRRAKFPPADRDQSNALSASIMGTLLLLLPLLPALNLNALNPGDFLHGRYTYLPLAGLMLLLAVAVHLAGKFKMIAAIAVGALAVGSAVLTVSQEEQWKDDLTLFTTAHQMAPHNAPVARNLADAHVSQALLLEEDGRCGEAIPVFEQVSHDYPDDWYSVAGLGYCYVQNNDLVKAEQFLHRAADLSRDAGITRQWQELRAHIGLPTTTPAP
jgi:hypothetical protein